MSIGKMLICNFWFVGKSVVNKFTNGFIDGSCVAKKQITRFILSVIPSILFSILPTGEPYVIPLVS